MLKLKCWILHLLALHILLNGIFSQGNLVKCTFSWVGLTCVSCSFTDIQNETDSINTTHWPMSVAGPCQSWCMSPTCCVKYHISLQQSFISHYGQCSTLHNLACTLKRPRFIGHHNGSIFSSHMSIRMWQNNSCLTDRLAQGLLSHLFTDYYFYTLLSQLISQRFIHLF